MDVVEPTWEELKQLRSLTRRVDDVLEESQRARESLEQTLKRLFPVVLIELGAKAVAVTTTDELLSPVTFQHGDFGSVFPGNVLTPHWGVRLLETGDTLVSQSLDVAGTSVGAIGIVFAGDRTSNAAPLARALETVAEQLDNVLVSVHTASEKHQLLMAINASLANRVFEVGMDAAVRLLCDRVRIPGLLVMYRDVVESGAVDYRIYKNGQLDFASNGRRHDGIDGSIRKHGIELVSTSDGHMREALGEARVVETVLISGSSDPRPLGKILVWSGGEGFGAYTMDLIRLIASTLSQRLIDYNRERIHLSQFFRSSTIDELLLNPEYERKHLTPRAEEVGILFADINGFTRICEQVLERPERIGTFVDDWSNEAVRILHNHDGVFDKMVGDCVIGLFGPPFFKSKPAERAAAAVRAALDIQKFTRDVMSAHPEVSRLSDILQLPGLGVAIGVNLTMSYCGIFGPNRNYTSFSTGMNQTARLQSLGGFRETLVMESARAALAHSDDPAIKALTFGDLQETPVKNVAQPLRYYRVL